MKGLDPNAVTETRQHTDLTALTDLVVRLSKCLRQLESVAEPLQLETLCGREWFELLTRKLLPQLADGVYLIVAVVGGTNIGKSVVFNHIAGFRASASSPLASGTKHPVCLVPAGFSEHHDLKRLFPSFELRPWTNGDEALLGTEEHCLFWREHSQVPENLVILDTPDVDSDAPVNWLRADAVRQAADVLVAVLTQQKYNDAAVKQFFRKAASEDKAAIIVFNQVELPDDEPYWPVWLNTFCKETGLKPEYVYLAPNNRKAAEAIALRFEERGWRSDFTVVEKSHSASASADGMQEEPSLNDRSDMAGPVSLSAVLSQFRFSEIKLRTLRGSLAKLIDTTAGVPSYLQEVGTRSRQFREAADVFASRGMVRQANWPAPPNVMIVDEMWSWWDAHREAWTAGIHGFYTQVGRWGSGGWKLIRDRVKGPPSPPTDEYRRQEWDAIIRVIEQVYDQLRVITTLGNELLTARLEKVLAGTSCEHVLSSLRAEHEKFDFDALVKRLVDDEMSKLQTDRQHLFQMMRYADRAAAVFRPAFTLLLAMGGGLGADHLLAEAATQSLTHLAVETTGAAATTVAGEAVVGTAGSAVGQVKAWLLQLHTKFKSEREAWLIAKLHEHLLGQLLVELQAGAIVPESSQFAETRAVIEELTERLKYEVGS